MDARRVGWICAAIAAAGVANLAAPARGQAVVSWMDPRPIKSRPVADYRLMADLHQAGVRHQDAHMRMEEHSLFISTPVHGGENSQWRITSQLSDLRTHTRARMPDTGEGFPADLWDVRMGVGYGRLLEGGKVLGVHAAVGGAGDQPFATAGETTLSATGFLYLPRGKQAGWLAYLTAQTQLDGTAAYVFPGAGYHVDRETFEGLLGLPALWAKFKPVKPLAIQGLLIPSRAMADATWALSERFSLFATYDWLWRGYTRHDRRDREDRLYYAEQRVHGGFEWNLRKNVKLVVDGGYRFDRRFFEADSFFWGSQTNRFSIGDGPFAYLRLTWRF